MVFRVVTWIITVIIGAVRALCARCAKTPPKYLPLHAPPPGRCLHCLVLGTEHCIRPCPGPAFAFCAAMAPAPRKAPTTPVVLLVGGMGAQASARFHMGLAGLCPNVDVVHLSVSSVADRTAALESGPAASRQLGVGVARRVLGHAQATVESAEYDEVVVLVCCYTFHSPPIWDAFEDTLHSHNKRLPLRLLKLTDLVLEYAASHPCADLRVLCTRGSERYQVFAPLRYASPDDVATVHSAIYSGLKFHSSGAPEFERASATIRDVIRQVLAQSPQTVVVLGCTELPLVQWHETDAALGPRILNPLDLALQRLTAIFDSASMRRLLT